MMLSFFFHNILDMEMKYLYWYKNICDLVNLLKLFFSLLQVCTIIQPQKMAA